MNTLKVKASGIEKIDLSQSVESFVPTLDEWTRQAICHSDRHVATFYLQDGYVEVAIQGFDAVIFDRGDWYCNLDEDGFIHKSTTFSPCYRKLPDGWKIERKSSCIVNGRNATRLDFVMMFDGEGRNLTCGERAGYLINV